MPLNRGKTAAKKPEQSGEVKQKSIGELLSTIDFLDDSLNEIAPDDLKNMVAELQTSASGRSPEEVDNANIEKYKVAMSGMQFAKLEAEKAVLKKDEVRDTQKIDTGVDEATLKLASKVALVFAFVHGNVTDKKYWVRLTHPGEDKKAIYCCWPHLNVQGSRSVLVHVNRDSISKFLEQGHKNAIVAVLEKANVAIKPTKLKYAFPKGHLMAPKEDIQKVRDDLTSIFTQMGKPVAERKYELKFLTVD